MDRNRRYGVTLLLAMVSLPTIVAAQSTGTLPPELQACTEETDTARRLECFDREMARLRAAPESPPAPAATPEPVVAETTPVAAVPAPAAKSEETAPSSVAATMASSADDDFGMPDEGLEQISATVVNIMKRPYGEMVILLDNGQIWEQKHRDNRFRLKVGDDFTVSEGLISGYRLTAGGRNHSIQVERLK